MKVAIAAEPFDSPDARRLVAALDAHLASRYAPEHRFGPHLKAEHIAPGVGTFVIARADGQAVGCGALRRRDASTVEVKRMYAEPEVRGRGVAREIPRPSRKGGAVDGCAATGFGNRDPPGGGDRPLPRSRFHSHRLFRRVCRRADKRLLREASVAFRQPVSPASRRAGRIASGQALRPRG
jgi:GNAT superfamily N-acetyltransferase